MDKTNTLDDFFENTHWWFIYDKDGYNESVNLARVLIKIVTIDEVYLASTETNTRYKGRLTYNKIGHKYVIEINLIGESLVNKLIYLRLSVYNPFDNQILSIGKFKNFDVLDSEFEGPAIFIQTKNLPLEPYEPSNKKNLISKIDEKYLKILTYFFGLKKQISFQISEEVTNIDQLHFLCDNYNQQSGFNRQNNIHDFFLQSFQAFHETYEQRIFDLEKEIIETKKKLNSLMAKKSQLIDYDEKLSSIYNNKLRFKTEEKQIKKILQEVKAHIGKNNLEKAIEILLNNSINNKENQNNEIILINQKLNKLNYESRQGLNNQENINIGRSKIANSLLSLIDNLTVDQ